MFCIVLLGFILIAFFILGVGFCVYVRVPPSSAIHRRVALQTTCGRRRRRHINEVGVE